MTRLDTWLKQATRRLSQDSVAQVRAEIQEHYESAHEAAMSGGATADEADMQAVDALADAKTASCQYRKVLLTAAEARLLRQGNREAQADCSHVWVKRVMSALGLTVIALFTAIVLHSNGAIAAAKILVVMGVGIAFAYGVPFLPIYTPSRALVFRAVKLGVMIAIIVSDVQYWPKWFWLLVSCLGLILWVEWRRASIQRKLPVAEWPKQLHL